MQNELLFVILDGSMMVRLVDCPFGQRLINPLQVLALFTLCFTHPGNCLPVEAMKRNKIQVDQKNVYGMERINTLEDGSTADLITSYEEAPVTDSKKQERSTPAPTTSELSYSYPSTSGR